KADISNDLKTNVHVQVESNARFVTWSDGSLQLVIGNEAFCISEQDAQGIASYLFLRHEKVLLDCYCPIDVFDLKEWLL
ncbi:UNVERIFIED_CONTAM: protein LEO1, partial [Sesamum latifolium]